MLCAALIMGGSISALRLPVGLLPERVRDSLTIAVRYPGQPPWRVERVITRPVEEAICAVGGIVELLSSSREGEAKIYVRFARGAPMKNKTLELRERIDPVRARFPREVEEPEIYGSAGAARPFMVLSLAGGDPAGLRDLAENRIKKRIERVEGVSEIAVGGGVRREIEVAVRGDRLVSHGLRIEQVMERIQGDNRTMPLGRTGVRTGYTVSTDGRFRSLADLRALPLFATAHGSPVLLGDIARVRMRDTIPEEIASRGGKETVSIYVFKSGTGAPLAVSRALAAIACEESGVIRVSVDYDEAERVMNAMARFGCGLAAGLGAAMLVIVLSAGGVRAGAGALARAGVSAMPALLFMFARGIGLNLVSLLALVTGVVLALAEAILFMHVARGRRAGDGPGPACARDAAYRMGAAFSIPVIAACLGILITGGGPDGMFGDFAVVLLIARVSSIPLMRFIPGRTGSAGSPVLEPAAVGNLFRTIERTAESRLPASLVRRGQSFRERFASIAPTRLASACALLLVAGAVLIAPTMYGGPAGPDADDELQCAIELPEGTTLDDTARAVARAERAILESGLVRDNRARISASHADLTIQPAEGADPFDTRERLRALMRLQPGIQAFFDDGSGTGGIDIEVRGRELTAIRACAHALAEKIAILPQAADAVLRFREGRPELQVIIDTRKAHACGIPPGDATHAVRCALYGPVAAKFLDRGEVDIRCRQDGPDIPSFDDVERLRIVREDGKAVPLAEIADFRVGTGVTTIWRRDKERFETVTAMPRSGESGALERAVDGILRGEKMPSGITATRAERGGDIGSGGRGALWMAGSVFLLIFMACAAVFESPRIALRVCAGSAVACACGLWTLKLCGCPLGAPGIAGLAVSAGIAAGGLCAREFIPGGGSRRAMIPALMTVAICALTLAVTGVPVVAEFALAALGTIAGAAVSGGLVLIHNLSIDRGVPICSPLPHEARAFSPENMHE